MAQISQILKWMCAFIIAACIAQLIATRPWAMWIIGIFTTLTYTIGFKQNDWQLQVIAAGLLFGYLKCFYGG